ncbi:MAG: MBL fold metallo-hydrolase [candidate division WS1 bacterium]|jgi:ribonuclease BN (tRNA processing enzyme)|nr:MBL fold metallo-hydrolase [candidate division WS1 bacterium]
MDFEDWRELDGRDELEGGDDEQDWDNFGPMKLTTLTTLTFVGVSSCTPLDDSDTASFLLNGHVLVDCGWAAGITMMRRPEYDATMLTHVLLTHCHQDHYMGLASVLFYRAMQAGRIESDERLVVAGPAKDIERIVDLTMAFIQADRIGNGCPRPEVLPLQPGDGLRASELDIATVATRHAVPSLGYRFLDVETGVSIGITGDTAYVPELARFFSGVDDLVTEGSTGLTEPPPDSPSGHQSIRQAAMLGRDAGAETLIIAHCDMSRVDEFEPVAREICLGVHFPSPGEQHNLEDRSYEY